MIFPDRLRVAEAALEKARVLERLAREAMRLLPLAPGRLRNDATRDHG